MKILNLCLNDFNRKVKKRKKKRKRKKRMN